MKITATHQHIAEQNADMLIIGHFQSDDSNKEIEALGGTIAQEFSTRLKNKDFSGNHGESLTLFNDKGQHIMVLGLGNADKLRQTALYETIHKAVAIAAKTRCETVANYILTNDFVDISKEQAVKLVVLASSHAEYRYEDTKQYKDDSKHHLESLAIFVDQGLNEMITQAKAMATGITTARHLGNNPPNIANPKYIAQYAESIAKQYDNCELEVLNHKQMKKMGMGALLAVGQGSHNKPKMVVLKYSGADKNQAPIALVGKGITFDTGGISLKPGLNMDEMKYDMCGAASVIGAFVATAKLQLPINLITIVPAVENMPDGNAYRPGDVVTSYSGKTIEVLNTDAEGRMILCDALTYAQEFKPSVLLDLATLTGACVVALGHQASAVMTKTNGLAKQVIDAGLQVHDRVWELPLWDEYQKQLDTTFADMKNTGGFPAGTITAGCFLSRFTEDANWAHIDIAGTAWNSKKEGATGRPVAMLTQFLINQAG